MTNNAPQNRKEIHATRQSLAVHLRQAIEDGEYKPGDALPTEAELVKQYSLSRHNVRIAMLELVNEGLIGRTPGQGTVVIKPTMSNRRVCLVVQEPREWLASGLAHGLMDAFKDASIRLELASCGDDQAGFDKAIDDVIATDCDGLMTTPLPWLKNNEWAYRLKRAGVPFVVNGMLDGIETNVVSSDNFAGGQIAARHLIEMGYRRLYIFSPELESRSDHQRLMGFLTEVARAEHVDVCLPVFFELTEEDKADHLTPWMSAKREWAKYYASRADQKEPIGVFATNDFVAYGVCLASRELGLRNGQDVGVVGFDDRELARTCEPPLTTIQTKPEESGRIAGRILIEQLKNPDLPLQNICATPTLIVRESTVQIG